MSRACTRLAKKQRRRIIQSMNPVVEQLVTKNQGALKALCNSQEVFELGLFGSATGDEFDPVCSDLDFVVEFKHPDRSGVADRFMNLATGLEEIFQRKVDLITKRSLKNPFFLGSVSRTKEVVYAG